MTTRKVGFRVGALVLGVVGISLSRPEVIVAQGPPPAGIRAEIVNPNRTPVRTLLNVRRRSTPVGRGALIGAIAGAAFGYLGTTEAGRARSFAARSVSRYSAIGVRPTAARRTSRLSGASTLGWIAVAVLS